MPRLGGMLRYGIPRYRLPDEVLDQEIDYLLKMGIEARTGTRVADPTKLLKQQAGEFHAVFVAIGAWVSRKLNVPGEDAQGVWPGLTFLRDVNSGARPTIGPKVLVIGGGDVAMDAARCARRLPGWLAWRRAMRCPPTPGKRPRHWKKVWCSTPAWGPPSS